MYRSYCDVNVVEYNNKHINNNKTIVKHSRTNQIHIKHHRIFFVRQSKIIMKYIEYNKNTAKHDNI